jgi:hypothetical protein
MAGVDAAKIAELNDALRQTGEGGRIVTTSGVMASGPDFIIAVMAAVRTFSTFTEDNDPYGEHDFGAVEVAGEKLFWKIDYYDQNGEGLSPDPANPELTVRVLTIMLASEY